MVCMCVVDIAHHAQHNIIVIVVVVVSTKTSYWVPLLQ